MDLIPNILTSIISSSMAGVVIGILLKFSFDKKLETFRQQSAQERHDLDRIDKYQLAALDERLRAHQEAYALSLKLINTIHSNMDAKTEVQSEFSKFRDKWWLYITNEVRDAIWKAVLFHSDYHLYLEMYRDDKSEKTLEKLNKAFETIMVLPSVISKGIDLEVMTIGNLRLDGRKITPIGIEDK